jgi:hypothetical protein
MEVFNSHETTATNHGRSVDLRIIKIGDNVQYFNRNTMRQRGGVREI